MSKIILTDEASTPATPTAGTTVIYTTTGGILNVLGPSGPAAPILSTVLTATGQMIYASAPSTAAALTIGATGQFLRVNSGATAPEWFNLLGSTVPNALGGAGAAGSSTNAARVDHVHALPVTAVGDLMYANGANTVTHLAIGAAGRFLRVNVGATAPEWATASAADVGAIPTSALTATNPSALGAVAPGSSNDVARLDHVHPFPTAGDVGAVALSTVTTAGDLIYGTGAGVVIRQGIGTVGQVLAVNTGATAPVWQNPPTFVAGSATSTAQYKGTGSQITGIAAAIAAASAVGGGVVEILPGSYSGGGTTLTLPANVSLSAPGGFGSVGVQANFTCTAPSGSDIMSVSGLYIAGSFTFDAVASPGTQFFFNDCQIETSSGPAITLMNDGWDISLTNCTVKTNDAVADVVVGPTSPDAVSITADNCGFINSGAPSAAQFSFNESFSVLDLDGCYLTHPVRTTCAAGTDLTVQGCTLNFAPNTPTSAFVFTGAGANDLNVLGSFSLNSIAAAGDLHTTTGGLVTAVVSPGTFLGTYQLANLPILSGENGVLAYTSDQNALYVRRSGGWERIATPSNANTWTGTQTFDRASIATAVDAGAANYTFADNTVAPLVRMDTSLGAPGTRTVTLFAPVAGDTGKQWVIFDALRQAATGLEPIDIAVPGGTTINGGGGPYTAITTDGGAIVCRVAGANAWETIGY